MTRCTEHAAGDPICLTGDLPSFTGRVELRDGPDFGRVSGEWAPAYYSIPDSSDSEWPPAYDGLIPEWTPAHDAGQLIGDVLALIGVGIVVAAFVWALLVLLLALS